MRSGLPVKQHIGVRGERRRIHDVTLADHAAELVFAEPPVHHVLLGDLSLRRPWRQIGSQIEITALAVVAVRGVEVRQMANVAGVHPGLLHKLSAGEVLLAATFLGTPGPLRKLPRPPTGGVAELFNKPEAAVGIRHV